MQRLDEDPGARRGSPRPGVNPRARSAPGSGPPAARPAPAGRTNLLIALLLAGIVVAVYGRMLGFRFNNADDLDYVIENAHVRAGLSAANVIWALTTFHVSNWHPLTWLSHMTDVSLYGLNPMGHHLTNLLFHLADTLLLFLLMFRLTGSNWKSGFVAAAFAIHPLHVESVAWVAERKDVLSTFLLFLTLIAYVDFARSSGRRPASNGSSRAGWRYPLAVALYALGLMAKPMLVSAPILLILLDYWPLRRPFGWKSLREKAPFFALAGASCVVTWLAQKAGGSVGSLRAIPLPARVDNAVVAYVGYLAKTFWPRGLAVFYPLPRTVPAWKIAGSAILLVAASAGVFVARRKAPYLAAGWAWYLVTLVPVIGLVQVGMQAMADRYTYVPLIGIFIMITWGAPEAARRLLPERGRRTVLAVAAGVMAAALAACAWVQVGYWKGSTTLFTRAVRVTSGNAMAYLNLGNALSDSSRWDEAIDCYRAALRTDPGEMIVRTNLGIALSRTRRFEEALEQFVIVAQNQPGDYRIQAQMGSAWRNLGRPREAVRCYRESLRLDPDQPQIANNLAWMLATSAGLVSPEEAIHWAEVANRAATDAERSSTLDTLAAAYAAAGRFDEAIASAETALQLAEAAGDNRSAASTREKLALYRSHRAYVEAASGDAM